MFKYKKQHVFAMIFMVIGTLLALLLPYITMKIIDTAIKEKDIALLIKLALLTLGVSLLQGGSKLLSDYIYSLIGKRMVVDLRIKIVTHLQKLSGKYYTNTQTGELIARVQSDVANVEEVATKMLFSVISDVLLSIGMLVFLIGLQFDLLIISLLLQPLMFFIQNRFNRKTAITAMESRNVFGELSILIQELFSAMMHFTVLNARKYFFKKYIPIEKNYIKKNIRLEMLFSSSMVGMNIISTLITITVLGYGGYKVILGTLTIGGLIAFNLYSQRLLVPIMRIAQLNMKFQQTFISINRIFEILDEPVEIKQENKSYKPVELSGKIEFKDVAFSYDNSSLIKNLNLQFEPGRVTAIVGTSGAGKTTISNLILRLWDVQDGKILIDGRDIKEYNLIYLRKNISLVSQDVFLLNDTVYNNIALSGNITMEEVIKAAKNADIYDFIQSLPKKFDTIVGERGMKLSGGQKQRISIARAIIRNSPIIILDEATSSLDNISEKSVQENLGEFLKDKTTIVIAHRLSTIENADKIYVLENGSVLESGRHNKLLDLKGIYYDLYLKNSNEKAV